jgi:hypothetical protein
VIPQNVKDYFCRHFLGRIKARSLPLAMDSPPCHSPKRAVETHPIRTKLKVTGSSLLTKEGVVCSSRGFRFSARLAEAKGAKLTRYAPEEMKVHTFSKLRTRTREDAKRVAVLPQERTNRLRWQEAPPKRAGEMVLAWFGPIIEEAVVKLTLKKRQGTLLIWYNPQSRRFDAKGLYLYRRAGIGGDLEWRWS